MVSVERSSQYRGALVPLRWHTGLPIVVSIDRWSFNRFYCTLSLIKVHWTGTLNPEDFDKLRKGFTSEEIHSEKPNCVRSRSQWWMDKCPIIVFWVRQFSDLLGHLIGVHMCHANVQ